MQLTDVTAILREYGQAIRGDWSQIDGRSVRSNLDELAHAVENPNLYTAAELRDSTGLCPYGNGHWEDYCEDYKCNADS